MLPRAVVDRAVAWGAGGNSGGAFDRLDMAVPKGGAVAAAAVPAPAINGPAAFLGRSRRRYRPNIAGCHGDELFKPEMAPKRRPTRPAPWHVHQRGKAPPRGPLSYTEILHAFLS
jgi:hypothetical protein